MPRETEEVSTQAESGDLSGITEMFGLRDGKGDTGTHADADTAGRWESVTEGTGYGSSDTSGRLVQGRYRLIAELGAGGMGVTYRAWDTQAGIPVVVKMPKREVRHDRSVIARFSREIEAMRAVPHPSIVPITDFGDDEGCPFVAMRFLPGGSLADYRRRDESDRPIKNPPGMLFFWLPGVAAALDHIHARRMLHRDVKPGNIFLDGFLKPYLGDFGIAKVVDDSGGLAKEQTLTGTKTAVGTPEYMPPELFKPNAQLDGRADQYALAVTVYEMLCGEKPFTGSTAHIIVEHSSLPVPPLERHCPGLPRSLYEAVHRALSKKPDERFATCGEFAEAALLDLKPLEPEADTVRLLCPSCKNILKLPNRAAGKSGKCPRCQASMDVASDLGSLWLESEERGGGLAVIGATVTPSQPLEKPEEQELRPGPAKKTRTAFPWAAIVAVVASLIIGYFGGSKSERLRLGQQRAKLESRSPIKASGASQLSMNTAGKIEELEQRVQDRDKTIVDLEKAKAEWESLTAENERMAKDFASARAAIVLKPFPPESSTTEPSTAPSAEPESPLLPSTAPVVAIPARSDRPVAKLVERLTAMGFEIADIPGEIKYENISKYPLIYIQGGSFHDQEGYLQPEVEAIKRYVADGGTLLFAGLVWPWVYEAYGNKPSSSFPLNQIGTELGFEITGGIGAPVALDNGLFSGLSEAQLNSTQGWTPSQVSARSPDSQVISKDNEGRPIVVAFPLGKGRVMVFGHPSMLEQDEEIVRRSIKYLLPDEKWEPKATPKLSMESARPGSPKDPSKHPGEIADLVNGSQGPKPFAHFLFNGNARDEVSDKTDSSARHAEYRDDAIYINGKYGSNWDQLGTEVTLRTQPMELAAFSVALRFQPESFGSRKNISIFAPRSYRWLILSRSAKGNLTVSLNQGKQSFEVPDAPLVAGQWAVVACGFDMSRRVCVVFFNGKKCKEFAIPPDFVLSHGNHTAFTFGDYSWGDLFHGLVDELIIYDRLLTDEEFAQLPLVVGTTSSAKSRFPPDQSTLELARKARENWPRIEQTGPAQLVAHYLFNGDLKDEISPDSKSRARNIEFREGAMYLNGKYEYNKERDGYGIELTPRKHNMRRFTVVMRFKAEDFDRQLKHRALLGVGHNEGFFDLSASDGYLYVRLTQDSGGQVNGVKLPVGKWVVLACGVDMDSNKCMVYVNNKMEGEYILPEVIRARNNGSESEVQWTFTDYGGGGAFHGLVDEFRVYDRLLTHEEFSQMPLTYDPVDGK